MSQIQTNNTDLQAILDAVNALPDKVESVEYETCSVSISYINSLSSNSFTCIVVENGTLVSLSSTVGEWSVFNEFNYPLIENVLCNSTFYVYDDGGARMPNWQIQGEGIADVGDIDYGYFWSNDGKHFVCRTSSIEGTYCKISGSEDY